MELKEVSQRGPYNLYCVGGDVKHCTIHNPIQGQSPGEVWGKALSSQIIIYTQSVYGRFPDGYFPGWFFSRKDVSRKVVSRIVIFPDRMFAGKMIPRWSLSWKDVSRVVIFPDETKKPSGKVTIRETTVNPLNLHMRNTSSK